MSISNPRALPAVEKILKTLGDQPIPRPVVTNLVRHTLQARREAKQGVADYHSFIAELQGEIDRLARTRIAPVINGTGVLIHTNLGRSPISTRAADRLLAMATQYNTLEYDLDNGKRGKRGNYLEYILAQLVDAEAATVVNNCAAALVIILRLFTAATGKKEVLISRGELIEIGGGFRVPEIMEASGATLREVGATNKTSLEDYARAIGPDTAMLLKVHRSNFYMEGFVDAPTTEEMAALSREYGLPLVEDLGSGAIAHTNELAPIEHEPTPTETLKRGVDLVCFSGDKIFGGPQSGIIAGRADLIADLKKEPFFRALRCDKMVLSVLEETAQTYLEASKGNAVAALPLLQMLSLDNSTLSERVEAVGQSIKELPITWNIGTGNAQVGGGTMPKAVIPSVTLDVKPTNMPVDLLAKRLRTGAKPVIGYVTGDVFKVDFRTVFPQQDALIARALGEALA